MFPTEGTHNRPLLSEEESCSAAETTAQETLVQKLFQGLVNPVPLFQALTQAITFIFANVVGFDNPYPILLVAFALIFLH